LIVSTITADGDHVFAAQTGGNSQEYLRYDASAKLVVINEDSGDVDFRVESNGNSSMLVVDGGADAVGIGTAVTASKDLTVRGVMRIGVAAVASGDIEIAGTTSGVVTLTVADAAGTWTMTLPADDGDAGEQLQTNGSGVCTWEAAGSMSAVKNLLGSLDAKASEALDRIKSRSVYAFQYKPDARKETGLPALSDTQTVFHGILAEEYPEVMMWGGKIFCPISAFGEAMLAIKALAEEVTTLKAQLAS
jgi:hypothetical protein